MVDEVLRFFFESFYSNLYFPAIWMPVGCQTLKESIHRWSQSLRNGRGWYLPVLFSRLKAQGQGQGLVNLSSRILEDKDFLEDNNTGHCETT